MPALPWVAVARSRRLVYHVWFSSHLLPLIVSPTDQTTVGAAIAFHEDQRAPSQKLLNLYWLVLLDSGVKEADWYLPGEKVNAEEAKAVIRSALKNHNHPVWTSMIEVFHELYDGANSTSENEKGKEKEVHKPSQVLEGVIPEKLADELQEQIRMEDALDLSMKEAAHSNGEGDGEDESHSL